MSEPKTFAQEAAEIARLQVEAEEDNEQAQREADERRADLHVDALDAIQAVLDGQLWTPETPGSIATILRAIGLPVRDVDELEVEVETKH
jgi:hypothetical protein